MHLETMKAEMAIRTKFDLGATTLVFPLWYDPHFQHWVNYFADSAGMFYRALPGKSPRRLSGWVQSDDYIQVAANKSHIRGYLHRIVCWVFNGPIPDGWHVHHIDGNRRNKRIARHLFGQQRQGRTYQEQ